MIRPDQHQYKVRGIEPFLKALGYKDFKELGIARFVAVSWGAGDEAYHHNGYASATGNFDAFLEYVNDETLRPLLGHEGFTAIMLGGIVRTAWLDRRWWLGSSEQPPTHYLVFDRDRSNAYLMPVYHAQKLLRAQWPTLNIEGQDTSKIEKWLRHMIYHWMASPLSAKEHSRRVMEARQYHEAAMGELHQALHHYQERN